MDRATYDVYSVTMRSLFYIGNDDKPSLCEYTLTRDEWVSLQMAHKLAKWIPFTCPATFMSEGLEDLVCGGTPERYKLLEGEK